MYQAGKKRKSKARRAAFWAAVAVALCGVLGVIFLKVQSALKPKTSITSTRSVTTKVSYKSATQHFTEADFAIDLPVGWQPVPRPPGTYNSFSWQTAKGDTDGQIITVYEDTIPPNFAVNRVQIVHSESDHLGVDGSVSDNCSTFTGGASTKAGQVGVLAKWEGVSFLCDQANTERDLIATSSADGINTVVLRSPGTGTMHKFLITYTDYAINPDYTIFYNALNSFTMQ